MNMFIGLDVWLANTAACIIDERGKILKEAKVDSEPEALIALLRGLSSSAITTGLEAGCRSGCTEFRFTRSDTPDCPPVCAAA